MFPIHQDINTGSCCVEYFHLCVKMFVSFGCCFYCYYYLYVCFRSNCHFVVIFSKQSLLLSRCYLLLLLKVYLHIYFNVGMCAGNFVIHEIFTASEHKEILKVLLIFQLENSKRIIRFRIFEHEFFNLNVRFEISI